VYLDYGVDWALIVGLALLAIGTLWGCKVFIDEHGEEEGCGFLAWTLGLGGAVVGPLYAFKSKGATICMISAMALLVIWFALSQ